MFACLIGSLAVGGGALGRIGRAHHGPP
jgi:hypothetical protein